MARNILAEPCPYFFGVIFILGLILGFVHYAHIYKIIIPQCNLTWFYELSEIFIFDLNDFLLITGPRLSEDLFCIFNKTPPLL